LSRPPFSSPLDLLATRPRLSLWFVLSLCIPAQPPLFCLRELFCLLFFLAMKCPPVFPPQASNSLFFRTFFLVPVKTPQEPVFPLDTRSLLNCKCGPVPLIRKPALATCMVLVCTFPPHFPPPLIPQESKPLPTFSYPCHKLPSSGFVPRFSSSSKEVPPCAFFFYWLSMHISSAVLPKVVEINSCF